MVLADLTTLDVTLFILSLLISVGIGLYFSNKNATLEDYMLGGRDQCTIPVAISMMTSYVSGLTLIGNSPEFYQHGIPFSMSMIAGQLLSIPLNVWVFLPVFYRLQTISIYVYIERRFGCRLRRIMSASFMILMILYNAVALYVPSLLLQASLGISEIFSIWAVGLCCLIYATLGGVKAVIWTDFFQAALMAGSLLAICILGTSERGGIDRLLASNQAGGRLTLPESFFEFNMKTRYNIWTIVSSQMIIDVFINSCNQVQVQRSLTLPTLRKAQWAMGSTSLMICMISMLASYPGMIIYDAYKDCDLLFNGTITRRDSTLIHYVGSRLSEASGLRGLFVAGIFAATLSNLSSFQNSMAALVAEDFLTPLLANPSRLEPTKLANRRHLVTWLGKASSPLFGIVTIAICNLVGRTSNAALLQLAISLMGALGAPVVAIYALGMCSRWFNYVGAVLGLLAGSTLGLALNIMQILGSPSSNFPSLPISSIGCQFTNTTMSHHHHHEPITQPIVDRWYNISFQWTSGLCFFTALVVGVVGSCVSGRNRKLEEVPDELLVSWLQSQKSDKISGQFWDERRPSSML